MLQLTAKNLSNGRKSISINHNFSHINSKLDLIICEHEETPIQQKIYIIISFNNQIHNRWKRYFIEITSCIQNMTQIKWYETVNKNHQTKNVVLNKYVQNYLNQFEY